MKIHLIRHAEPNSTSASGKDIDRTLSNVGIQQADALGKYLNGRLDNCEVWCSAAQRTRLTLEGMSKSVSFGECSFYGDFHLCPKSTFLHYLWQSDSGHDLVIIGHNFGISDLLSYFTNADITMNTSEYICIEFEDLGRKELSQSTGVIIDRYRP